jgi:monoamine oxidase
MIKTDILIIGAGLTGLTLNHYLKRDDINAAIVEARDRIGGRIYTQEHESGKEALVEMGATWMGTSHQKLFKLLRDLDIELFQQILGDRAIYEPTSMSPHQVVSLPEQQEPSFRIKDGTSTLIDKLSEDINSDLLFPGQPVHSLTVEDGRLVAEGESLAFSSRCVISTLPPRLLYQKVEIDPPLPDSFQTIMAKTHTWMGESIKFGLTFRKPFWRDKNTSGTLFSNVGPITEMYDHSSFEDDRFALMGFLNGSYFSLSRDERRNMVIDQLRRYYGDQIDQNLLHYHELVWSREKYTYIPYEEHVLPHQNNGHDMYQEPYLNGKLFIAGAETSPISPGYMDGAVSSAKLVYNLLRNSSLIP